MKDINALFLSLHNCILVVVALVLIIFDPGCRAVEDIDPDINSDRESEGAISADEGNAKPNASIRSRPTTKLKRSTDGIGNDGAGRDGSTPSIDSNVECVEPSDCPAFADQCLDTLCVDGTCETTKSVFDTECDAKCRTITDGCEHIPNHTACDDNNPCTVDSCTSNGCENLDNGMCDDAGFGSRE